MKKDTVSGMRTPNTMGSLANVGASGSPLLQSCRHIRRPPLHPAPLLRGEPPLLPS